MHQFGLELSDLKQRGGDWTAREIAQQPRIWREVVELMKKDSSGLADFLTPLLQRRDLRIVLTGAGSSSYIGECLAPAIVRRHGRLAAGVSTTDIVSGPESHLVPHVPTLLVSFARSGNSPESTAALDLAERCVAECHHLVFTCNPEGDLYRRAKQLSRARIVLMPEETDDRGFAMTSSFSGMLLAAALAFNLPVLDKEGTLSSASLDVPAIWRPQLQNIVAQRFERIVYLGAHELRGLARESALKMLELTDGRVITLADTPLGFRHGPKTIVNGKTLVVAFMSNDSYTRRYDVDLLTELRADGIAGRALALTAQAQPTTGQSDDLLAPGLSDASDLALCLPFAVFAQSLALLQSLSLGLRPDTPNATGAVNRVVRGVTIHPLQRTT